MHIHDYIILGAGISGSEFGRLLSETASSFIILEKEAVPGGLCRTNQTSGYYWDFAVHALYSRDQEILEYYTSLPINYGWLDRSVKIYHSTPSNAYLLNYPFEMGIQDLPITHRLECIIGYLATRLRPQRQCHNLLEWIENFVGYGMSKHFMQPYNEKIWSCALEEISEQLVSSKIEPAPIWDFIRSALGGAVVGRAYQAKFIYPRNGVQDVVDYTLQNFRDRLITSNSVTQVVRENDYWVVETDSGQHFRAQRVVSTIPLVELLKICPIDTPARSYPALKWNNTYFAMIGLKHDYHFRMIADCHWVFFKGSEIFYRVTLMHNFSPDFPPVLIAEITEKDGVAALAETEILERVVTDLLRLQIVDNRKDIAVTDIKLIPYTYPIPTVGLDTTRAELQDTFESNELYFLGRNGNWDYMNMDGCIRKARTLFERLKPSRPT